MHLRSIRVSLCSTAKPRFTDANDTSLSKSDANVSSSLETCGHELVHGSQRNVVLKSTERFHHGSRILRTDVFFASASSMANPGSSILSDLVGICTSSRFVTHVMLEIGSFHCDCPHIRTTLFASPLAKEVRDTKDFRNLRSKSRFDQQHLHAHQRRCCKQ